ncbi:MAG: hypothetical protein LBS09_09070 [Bacteroidales bacterium]|jgi:hypothetical protein|nr:hypothetical protein [Bacteroidales bacterium]
MKWYFIALACTWIFVSCSSVKNNTATQELPVLQPASVLQKYRIWIKTGHEEISGIMVLKYTNNQWRGSLMSVAGAKVFDFIADGGSCRLLNVIPQMNKWYIRRTVESDVAFLMWGNRAKNVKKKNLQQLPDGTLLLKNTRRKIEYTFKLLEHEITG